MAADSSTPISNLDGAPEDFKLEHDFKRDSDHRHKWALGVDTRAWNDIALCNDNRLGGRPARPVHPWSR